MNAALRAARTAGARLLVQPASALPRAWSTPSSALLGGNACWGRAASTGPAVKDVNVAIIAHVDHGKTTLVDCLLKEDDEGGADADGGEERAMDSLDQERERGITIQSKVRRRTGLRAMTGRE